MTFREEADTSLLDTEQAASIISQRFIAMLCVEEMDLQFLEQFSHFDDCKV